MMLGDDKAWLTADEALDESEVSVCVVVQAVE